MYSNKRDPLRGEMGMSNDKFTHAFLRLFVDVTNQHIHTINEQEESIDKLSWIHTPTQTHTQTSDVILAKQFQIETPASTIAILLMNENDSIWGFQIKDGIRDIYSMEFNIESIRPNRISFKMM